RWRGLPGPATPRRAGPREWMSMALGRRLPSPPGQASALGSSNDPRRGAGHQGAPVEALQPLKSNAFPTGPDAEGRRTTRGGAETTAGDLAPGGPEAEGSGVVSVAGTRARPEGGAVARRRRRRADLVRHDEGHPDKHLGRPLAAPAAAPPS